MPDTAGPVGRLKRLINAKITKYLGATATPGVATGARVKVEQREGVEALTQTARSNVDGSQVTLPWGPPELLDSLDSQLVSIDDAIPRVFNGNNWTAYQAARVLTQKLSQQVMHTVNGVLQAEDHAWMAGVTCSVWTQTVAGIGTSYVGFRSDNGAWVVTQSALYTAATASIAALAKVVTDGTSFWVFFNTATQVAFRRYDANGVNFGGGLINLPTDFVTPGAWDISATPSAGGYTALYAAPSSMSASTGITFLAVGWTGSAVISNVNTDATMSGNAGVSFLYNDTGNALSYLATVIGLDEGIISAYEVTNQAQTHFYNNGITTGDGSVPDSVIGWAETESGIVNVYLSIGFLSNAPQTVGPKFDTRLRKTLTYHALRAGGTATLIKQANQVIPVSRAFKVDADFYAITYYQGGPGLTAAPVVAPVTWTTGDFMKGPAVQPLPVAPGDFQYGDPVPVTHSPGDSVAIGGFSGVTVYTLGSIPPSLAAMSAGQLSFFFAGGGITVAGASHSGNNGSFAIQSIAAFGSGLIINCPGGGGQVNENFGGGVTISLSEIAHDAWELGGFGQNTGIPDASWIGENLAVTGTSQPANWGAFPITSIVGPTGGVALINLTSPGHFLPEVIPNPVQPTASFELQLADPATAYEFFLQSVTFDSSYVGGFLSVQFSGVTADNTTYQIQQITGTHSVIATPLNLSTNQVNRAFPASVSIAITFPTQQDVGLQQTWFVTPLAQPQVTTGRFEYGIAYADWRFDGQTPNNTYPFAVTSVSMTSTGLRVLLPYRAESFSAGVTTATGAITEQSLTTVGLKLFTLSQNTGQSLAVGGELIIPGPQASEFTASGFAEQGINLGFETPFMVSQTINTGILGLTPGVPRQIIAVAEFTDEDGDRIYSIPSQPLNFTMTGTNNVAVIGGNRLGPTNRLVSIALYATSIAGGTTTVQHYKVTDDADPTSGFTFPDAFTWNFTYDVPDVEILESEILYTDKGFLPRYPCPAFIQGVGTWQNRTWVIGYDGAIWMSGEKTEGDAVWFHPAFRFLLPADDDPNCLAAMDDYLIITAGMSDWYIPKSGLPGGNGQPADLPTPVRLPFANGGTGVAATTRDGVIYASTAGGPWLVTRNLTNVWLGQPIQTSLGLTPITDIAVDLNQRVAVATGGTTVYVWDTVPGAWYEWVFPSPVVKLSVWQGNFVYADGALIVRLVPGQYGDNLGDGPTATPMTAVLAPLHFMGSVRGFGRCWAFQLQGEYEGPHTLTITIGYGDEADWAPATVRTFTPDPTKTYAYEINPKPEEASQFELTFEATPTGGSPGNSATWELVSADCGVDQGLARLPAAKRVT